MMAVDWSKYGVYSRPEKQDQPESEAIDWSKYTEKNKENSYLFNLLHGFAARGNQAIAAVNPWADLEKIKREQEWVKQNKGANVGAILADMAITAPAGGLANAPARALASGIEEAITTPGDMTDRLKELGLGTLGAGIGEGTGAALGFLAKPFSSLDDPVRKKMIDLAEQMGIKLNAAQKTGNKTLQYADSALDFLPSSSVQQQEFKNAQRNKWKEALFNKGHQDIEGIDADNIMGEMKKRISDVYSDVSSRNNITMDQSLKDALDAIGMDRNLNLMDVNKKPIVQQYLTEFNGAPIDAQISGKGYQAQRSLLDRQAKAFENSNPAESQALKGIRTALDDAMLRSVTPDDANLWKGANNDWMVMKSIEPAVDATTSEISPAKLMSGLARKDKNRVIYGNGDQELTDIAKVGNTFISPKTNDSGTAQRIAMMKLLTGAGAAGFGADLAATHDPVDALGGAGMAALSALLIPKAAAKAMQKTDGYLVKGLLDMTKESLPGLTRQDILQGLLRNVGLQTLNYSE